jgi:hypothetical protein
MDARTNAYLRDRRRLTGSWNVTSRLIAGAIGAAVGALTPGNPTPLENAEFTFLKAVSGFVIVETAIYFYRFIWIAPRMMYFDALSRVKASEETAVKSIAVAQERCDTKLRIYTANISSLQQANALLQAQLERKQKDQEFADVLTERYTNGVNEIMNWSELRKAQSFASEDFTLWNERENEWTAGVRQLLEQHGCNAQIIAHFWTIHEVPYHQFHHFHHVSDALSMFSERLKRLKAIINDYAETKILKDF